MKNKTKANKKTTTKNITSTQDLYIVKISKSFFFVSYTFLTFFRSTPKQRFRRNHKISVTDLPSTSNDDGCRKSFPFENEEHRLSAMQSLAEHNAYLNETNTASSLAKNSFKDWTMPGKKVFKGNDIFRRSGATSSEIPDPPNRVVTPSAINGMY